MSRDLTLAVLLQQILFVVMQKVAIYFALTFLIIGCQSQRAYTKDLANLKGRQLPPLVVNDQAGKRVSTFIFREKEQASIFIFVSDEKLKMVTKPNEYAWRILDGRTKPWYYPSFIYNRRYSKYKSLIIDSTIVKHLGLKPANYHIHLTKGKILKIELL